MLRDIAYETCCVTTRGEFLLVAFDICMIATVKLVRPDELLSLIREAADLPRPLMVPPTRLVSGTMSAFGGKADMTRTCSDVCF